MKPYKSYQNARDVSWKILLDFKITELPVKISYILKKMQIPLLSYRSNADFIKKHGLEQIAQKSDGFTIREGNRYFVFFNDQSITTRTRFTLAHELGHIFCGHLPGKISDGFFVTTRNQEPSPSDLPQEREEIFLPAGCWPHPVFCMK